MSIAHELSCDVATAMLANPADEQRGAAGGALTDIVLEVHTTLRRLTNEARQRRAQAFRPEAPPNAAGTAASGGY
ncbi:MAG TPA: hypothetical protein VF064_09805 [Pyrinomonadaceae bacterium]